MIERYQFSWITPTYVSRLKYLQNEPGKFGGPEAQHGTRAVLVQHFEDEAPHLSLWLRELYERMLLWWDECERVCGHELTLGPDDLDRLLRSLPPPILVDVNWSRRTLKFWIPRLALTPKDIRTALQLITRTVRWFARCSRPKAPPHELRATTRKRLYSHEQIQVQIPRGMGSGEITRCLSEVKSRLRAMHQIVNPGECQSARPVLMHSSERGFERDLERFRLATKTGSSYRRIAHYEDRRLAHSESYPLQWVRAKKLPLHPTERAIARSVKRMEKAPSGSSLPPRGRGTRLLSLITGWYSGQTVLPIGPSQRAQPWPPAC